MSFPAEGLESAWRNSLDSVVRLLKQNHPDSFMIWNLQDRDYDYEKFDNQVRISLSLSQGRCCTTPFQIITPLLLISFWK